MEKWPSLPGLSSGTILDTALHSAGTWELTHLRATLLTTIIDGTSILDDTNYQSWYSSPKLQPPPSIDENRLRQVISVYEFTLFAPTEYLTRATRQSLVQRAMAADVILCQRPDLLDGSAPRALAVLREFLKRYISFQGSLDHEVSSIFIISRYSVIEPPEDCPSVPQACDVFLGTVVASHSRSPGSPAFVCKNLWIPFFDAHETL